ncbi:MAG: porin family protein [Bacteroides sp.]
MKRALLLLLLIACLFPCSLAAQRDSQEKIVRPNTRKVNFGIKAGFNSSMFLVSDFKIKDVTIDEIQNKYLLGYFGALFMRINMKKHFLQPEISYNISKCEITFDKLGSQHPDIEPDYASVHSTIHSIDFPLLYGYNIVKQGPYGMSIFAGPKLRYLWNKQNRISFENFDQKGINEELNPFNVSAVIGVAVNISRIFFDFRYEQGLRNISKSVTYDSINPDGSTGVSEILFRRRDNVLSFSLGVIF